MDAPIEERMKEEEEERRKEKRGTMCKGERDVYR